VGPSATLIPPGAGNEYNVVNCAGSAAAHSAITAHMRITTRDTAPFRRAAFKVVS
jgi:hypothetical protein